MATILEYKNPGLAGVQMNKIGRALISIGLIPILASAAMSQGKKGPTAPASIPSPAASAPSSSNAPFESQMLAFGGLNIIAANVAGTVCKNAEDGTTVVIYDQTSFASIQAYEAFVANIRVLFASYQTLITPPTAATNDTEENTYGIGLSSTIDPFSDATSLLSALAVASNTESAGAITIPDSAMAISLTKQFRNADSCKNKNLKIIYPPLFGSGSTSDYASADLQSEIKKLDKIRRRAQVQVDGLNAAFIKEHGTGSTGDVVLTSALTDINGLYDAFMNSLLQVSPSSGIIGSAAVIQGYQLAVALRGPKVTVTASNGNETVTYPHPAYVLLASIASAGGTQHNHKNIWTALWSGDKITYSGGLVVNVALWKSLDSQPIYVDVLRYRSPLTRISSPSNTANVADGDNLAK